MRTSAVKTRDKKWLKKRKKQGYATRYDRLIDTNNTQQHRNRSATRDASRRATEQPLRHAQLTAKGCKKGRSNRN